jgi:hypothetical protein
VRWRPTLVLVIVGTLGAPTANPHAQGLSVDVAAGRVIYEPVSARIGSNSLTGTLRLDAPGGAWIYGAGAVPIASDLTWGGLGAGVRLMPRGTARRVVNAGIDLGGHAFLFRDAVASTTGNGTALDALPFLGMASGPASVEVRGGWRGQTLSSAGLTERRGVLETGVRAGYGGAVRAEADARWVRADGVMYPFAGGTLSVSGSAVQAWAQAGRWLSTQLDEVSWGGGLGVAIGRQSTLWASARQEAPDPLYWNVARRSWSVGVTRRLGRTAPRLQPQAAQGGGVVVVELAAADAPGTDISIAGDFSGWEPVAMQRVGETWTARLTLAPGVYSYAFRSGGSRWFVPASVAGRRSDGMGGYVARLIVE